MTFLGEALSVARQANGITQDQLAQQAGITQAALSRYEHDLREPSDEVLENLADKLGITPELLRRGQRIGGAMAVDAHMRRRATANVGSWRRLEARLNMHRLHTHQLMEEVAIRTNSTIPTVDPIDVEPSEAAAITRMQWRLPVGPVRNLVTWIESAGCLVIEEDFGTHRVDGLSQWIDSHPVILINAAMPTDRKRLTLAHELGHLVLHADTITSDPEGEANQFAAEFLMPAAMIRPELKRLTLGQLQDLKRVWMVSMQALIERAHSLGVLNSPDRTRLYKQLSARGWRKKEPISELLPHETPALPTSIGTALRERGLSPEEIDRIAGYSGPNPNNPFQPSTHDTPPPGRHLKAV